MERVGLRLWMWVVGVGGGERWWWWWWWVVV